MEPTNTLIDQVLARRWTFLWVFFLVFSLSYGLLFAFDFLPEPKSAELTENSDTLDSEVTPVVEEITPLPDVSDEIRINEQGLQSGALMPESLTIPSLDRTVPVLNPVSRSVADLDNALLSGLVRHPDSAILNQNGNIFILGHSSYLPNVLNRNFQAFNGIQNLVWGDTLIIKAEGTEYIYQVTKVYEAKASNLVVPIAGDKKKLTLATCNSFGSTDDRYIVEADLVETKKS